MKVVTRLEFNHFDAIAAKLPLAVATIVETSARAIEKDAKERAPVKTGTLRGSIKSEHANPQRTMWVVYTNIIYAPFQEFGVPSKRIPAKKFFTGASEAERPRFIRDMSNLEDKLR